jgi:outer membrane protein
VAELLFATLVAAAATATSTPTLTLEAAVAQAVRTSPAARGSEAARARAELAELRSQLDRFSLRVDAQLQEVWAKTSIGADRDEGFSGWLGLSNLSARVEVPIFSGFRVEANVARAQHLAEAAAEDLAAERRAAAVAAARAYWGVRKLAFLRDLQAQALTRLLGAEAIARARVEAGLAPPLDQNRAEARRRLQAVTLADLDGQRAEAEARLAVLLGLPGPVQLVEAAPTAAPVLVELQDLLRRAEALRPELKAARARLGAQEEAVRMALSEYYPQLGAYALLQYGNNPALAGAGSRAVFPSANPFSQLAGDVQVGLTLAVNLFDTLNTHTKVKDARLEAARLEAALARAAQGVEEEVRAARARVARYVVLAEALAEAEALARDNLKISLERYEGGDALLLELLDAELELLDVERRRADARAELALAAFELEAAVGGML